MFPSQIQFNINSSDNTYQKINGKRNIAFNNTEKGMARHFQAILGKNLGEDYNPRSDTFFYGGNIYHYENSLLKSIVPSWDLRNQIMEGSMVETEIPIGDEVRDIGRDILCPIKYNRLYFGNFILEVDNIKFIMHIMHPINSCPLINDPRRQLCIYISSNHRFNDYIESIGSFGDEEYYPVIHKRELTENLYIHLMKAIQDFFENNNTFKSIVFNPCNSLLTLPNSIEVNGLNVEVGDPQGIDSYNLSNRKVTVLGGQTEETCSMLWFHIHVLLDCDIENGIWNYNTKPIHLTSYMDNRKYDW